MKFIHISDLHLGKRVNDFSMLEDQKYIMIKIINVIDDEKPDGVIIAGDIYDKSIPSAEAVEMFDDFLVRLAERKLQVFIISGNHDSPERLAFGGRIMDLSGVHISPVYNGKVNPITISDGYGSLNVYLLPFVKPANVRQYFENKEINTYTDAVRAAVEQMNINCAERNILVTHQFVTGATRSESEEISVGGSDNVDAEVFEAFDYVALGHIHGPQNVGSEKTRYSGTPLKYSFSEVSHQKSVTVVDLKAKKDLSIKKVVLVPQHDMVEIKGTYMDLTSKSYYEGTSYINDYVHITLTDEDDIPDAIGKLRIIYKNLMKLDYDNTRTRRRGTISGTDDIEKKTPLDLFSEFYELQNNKPMSCEQKEYIEGLIKTLWEDEQ